MLHWLSGFLPSSFGTVWNGTCFRGRILFGFLKESSILGKQLNWEGLLLFGYRRVLYSKITRDVLTKCEILALTSSNFCIINCIVGMKFV
jgi:hypothetical protein